MDTFYKVPSLVCRLLILAAVCVSLAAPGALSEAAVCGDFNGDGYTDISVGVPAENVGSTVDAGAVHLLYGGADGMPTSDQVWHLNSPNLPLVAIPSDGFGSSLAAGNFNNDGYDDLAIGIPNKDNGRGQVMVMYGGAEGLAAAGSQVWDQNTLQDTRESDDRFGSALAAGDFDADGYADLAIGVPGEDFPDAASNCLNGVCTNAGVVNLIYGSATGLTAAGNTLWHQDRGVSWDGWVEWWDCFGSSLAAGDFDNDDADDLAVGVPCEHTGGGDIPGRNHGAVNVYYGVTGVGLTGEGAQYLRQFHSTIVGDPQPDDAFGYSLATGDINDDGCDDLIVGVPGEGADIADGEDAGAVAVFYGSVGSGLYFSVANLNELLSRSTTGLSGDNSYSRWGTALAVGDFDADGFADVAVGAPVDDVGGVLEGGSLSILFGSATGFASSGNQLISQNTPGINDATQSYDWFGQTLMAGDVDGDGVDDVAVGVPFEDVGGVVDSGAINLLYGAPGTGISYANNQFLQQNSAGVSDTAETGDQFGGRWLPKLKNDPWPTEPPPTGTPTITPNGGSFSGSVDVTLATVTSGATIYYTTNGLTPSRSAAPYTGPFTLTSTTTVKAFAVAAGCTDSVVASATFTLASGGGQQPYGGSPWPVPGTVEAEDYDTGGEGVAYHDRNVGNNGAQYRTDDVDIWYSNIVGNYTGANATGDWLEYTVDVATTGQYQLDLRVATPYSGRQLRVDIDGTDVTGLINLPNTGGWLAWQTVSTTATLTGGQHVLRISVVVGGLNFNWMDFYETGGTPTAATPTITPNGGSFSGSVDVTLATVTSGATIYYTTNGLTPSRSAAPNTGPFTLTSTTTVKAFAVAAGCTDSVVASATFTLASGGGQQPYGGSPWPVPGTVEAEDYDTGGEGVAYHDRNVGNNGAQYRTDDVDIWYSNIVGNYTGANATGDWLEYTVDVATTGQYQLDLRVATPYSGRQLRVDIDGTDVTGLINLPNTGGWLAWQTVSTTATLTGGQHVLRISVVVGGLNFNWMDFYETGGTPTAATPTITPNGGSFSGSVDVTLATVTSGATIYYTTNGSTPSRSAAPYTGPFTLTSTTTVKAFAVAAGCTDSVVASATFTLASGGGQQPYGGSPWPVPGTVEAEDYDTGGEGVAYHDRNVGNNGAQYRTDDVDIWYSNIVGNYTGANATGDWLEYTVDVATTGQYQLDLRVATPYSGRQLRVDIDGTDVTGLINLPNTGGWLAWQTVSTTATLTGGQHVLRISVVVGGLNFNWMDFYETGGTPTAATPTITPNGGSFSGSVDVTLATVTSGATIYYTTNGSTPSRSAAPYTGPFTLTSTTTVKAFAVAAGCTDSVVASATFTVALAGLFHPVHELAAEHQRQSPRVEQCL